MNSREGKPGMIVIRELQAVDRISSGGEPLPHTDLPSSEVVQLHTNPRYPLLIDPDHRGAVENFGLLRTRLLNARAKSGLCSVLITSAQKQEGKSLISYNLAISLAQLGRDRILLVDGDLRMKGLTKILGLQESVGLSDFLQDRAAFDTSIRQTSLSHLWVAGAGGAPDESLPAILEGPRWLEFLEQAKRDFGLVIVDSVPASAPIADFELLLAGCDSALLVVQLRKAKWEALEQVSNRMNGKLIGMVVNNTEPPADVDYYSYIRGR